MNQESLEELLDRYLQNQCTEEEKRLVEKFYESFSEGENQPSMLPFGEMETLKQKILTEISADIHADKKRRKYSLKYPVRNFFAYCCFRVPALGAITAYQYFLFCQ
ncbi:MAG: hypothetical protein R3C61_23515 [Bacteroidia bacterium]